MINVISLPVFNDDRGKLISLEENNNIPFEIKRVYYMYDINNKLIRGKHAHKDLEQVAVCVNGSCEILLDNGTSKERLELNSPETGLLIGSMIWREIFNFSNDCVLIVLASQLYDESDYIRSYDEFIQIVKQ
jgi:dTDP-4-dehydrorhamnose 3,5-epimerase-like enzyme